MTTPCRKLLPLLALPFSLTALAAPAKPLPAPLQALEQQGYEILDRFPAPGGMTGYAALYLSRPQTIYLTADGKQVIVGTMLDGKGQAWNQAGLDKQFSQTLWRQLENSFWIADGDGKAPRVLYAFTDPNCPYCNKFWNDARPWVRAGKVQIRHIMVGIIKPDSPGKAAAILGDSKPEAAFDRHERQHASGGVKPLSSIPPAIQAKLDSNHRLMERFGAFATPVIFFKDEQGKMQKVQGAPPVNSLPKILGPR
ncbi:thiol:disulfide interchange protein DsbG [Chromobacterium vaccinii]|uniref:thiol:disulfide interchange protein DsbG n=1 Tax=Chromobacterium vaccinii TaxID=1108595 RepID=UPI003C74FB7C